MPLSVLPQYVLFDWDGTLAFTRDNVVSSINAVLKEYGYPDWTQMQKRQDPKLSLRDNFINFFDGDADSAYEKYVEIYRRQIPELVKAFPHAAEVLEFLREKHVSLMIMTNKDRRLFDVELPQLYNPAWFERVVCGHEAPKDKPWPEHIFYTLRGLLTPAEISPRDVWMVGDSPQDSDCALAAHALPIRVGTPIWGGSAAESTPGVVYIKDFASFYEILAKS